MQIPAALDPVVEIQDKFADAVLHVKTFRDETTLIIAPGKTKEVLLYLRNTPGQDVDVSAGSVLYVPKHVVHRFHTIEEGLQILVFFAPEEGGQP